MNPIQPRVVVPSTTRRDALLAAIAGVLVLGFVGWGIVQMSGPVTGNRLTGVVVEKTFTKQDHERQISFSGRKVEAAKEIDGEYVLKVRVEKENRVYEVPVEKEMYDAKKVGDTQEFLRPESEQH